MSDFTAFLEHLTFSGLEHFHKYYGVYRGTVTANDDPQNRGRIKVWVPEVGQSEAPDIWVDPSFDYAGASHGAFFPPEVKDSVRVAFESGNPGKPIIYWGGWYGTSDTPSKLKPSGAPTKRGIVTKSGHALVFDDAVGQEAIEISWKDGSATIKIDSMGKIEVKTGQNTLTMDDKGSKIELKDTMQNTITMSPSGVSIKTNLQVQVDGTAQAVLSSSAQAAVRAPMVNIGMAPAMSPPLGEVLIAWLASHIHACGVGPTTPPVVPPTPALLSQTIKISP